MKIIITTGTHRSHQFFLCEAMRRFSPSIQGIIIQHPKKGRKPIANASGPWLSVSWIAILYFIRSKYASLKERSTFRIHENEMRKLRATFPILETTEINSAEVQAWIDAHPADMLLVFGGEILEKSLIERFKNGIINLHTGIAPDYKGAHCIEWPIYHGMPHLAGITIHYLDELIDNGAIFVTKKLNPRQIKNPACAIIEALKTGIGLLIETFERTQSGANIYATTQEKAGFCYYEKHFSKEIHYGAWKRTQKSLPLWDKIFNRSRIEVFNILRFANFYKKLFPPLPYPAIVLYHDIGDSDSPYLRYCNLSMEVLLFREHIRALAAAYRVTTIPEIRGSLLRGQKMENAIAFCFDDGFKGNLGALSILEAEGLPAAMYVCSAFTSKEDLFWRNKLSWLLHKGHFPILKKALSDLSFDTKDLAKENAFTWTRAKVCNPKIEKTVSRVFFEYGDLDWKDLYAGWDDLRNVNRKLFKFGNHSVKHLCLSSLSAEEQETDIRESQKKIFQELGNENIGFSIPFGGKIHYNDATVDIVANKMNDFYLTAYGGLNTVGLGPEIKRIGIPNVHPCQLPKILWDNL